MDIRCTQCKQTYQVDSQKSPLDKPAGVAFENRNGKLRVSWWRHGLPVDLRWGAVLLGALTMFFASPFFPPLRELQAGSLPEWVLAFVTGTFVLGVMVFLFQRLVQRQVIEVDSLTLRTWNEPLGMSQTRVQSRQVQQLYVTREGELRCQLDARKHQVLLSGKPDHARYAEQEIEQFLNVQDRPVDGEWKAPAWIQEEWRTCPHCQHKIPRKEISRQAEPLAQPAGTTMEHKSEDLVLRWQWRSSPNLAFFTVWLLIWDSVCLGFVAVAMNRLISQGDPKALGIFLVPHIWVGVLATYYYLALLINKTVITCERTTLRIDRGPLPFKGAHRQYKASDLRQLYVTTHRGKSVSYSLDASLHSGERVTLASNEPQQRLAFLEQEIERYYEIADDDSSF